MDYKMKVAANAAFFDIPSVQNIANRPLSLREFLQRNLISMRIKNLLKSSQNLDSPEKVWHVMYLGPKNAEMVSA